MMNIAVASSNTSTSTTSWMLGRMNAAYRAVSWGVVPFGAAFGGVLAKWFGLRTPFFVAGLAMLPIALFAHRILRPVEAALA